MGRKRVSEGRRGRAIAFNPPLDSDIMERIDRIADRERATRTSIILKALEAYDKKHGKGNYQTMIPSYGEGGEKSNAQVESLVRQSLNVYDSIRYSDVLKRLKSNGVDPKDRASMGRRIASWLREQGKEVIY
jgi:hypothetical protein